MTFISDFTDMFATTAALAPFVNRDAYGAASYGSPTTYKARLVDRPSLVKRPDGQEIQSRSRVWLLGAPAVSDQDQITLADGTTPSIVLTERYSDETGFVYTKVYFG